MTVVYDLQGTQSIHHGERGIARYVLELALALDRVAPGAVDLFAVNPDLPVPASLEPWRAAGRLVPVDDERVGRCDLYHVASPMENGIPGHRLLPPAVRRGRAAIVATVYDLIPLVYEEHYLVGEQNRAEYARGLAVLHAADELLAISHATAADTTRLLGIDARRITTIGAGAADRFRRATPAELDRQRARLDDALPALRDDYLLVPTGIDFRKNVEGTIASYALLRPEVRARHQLVIACRVDHHARRHIEDLAARHGVPDDVVLTGFVPDDLLVALYQLAHLVVFPSRYEGFGLPPLEARQCGAPVICGDNSSLREVITDPRARFDADDPAAIAAVMTRVLDDPALRRTLAEAPLPDATWDRAAVLTAAVYRRVRDAHRARAPRPSRIVVVGGDARRAHHPASGTSADRPTAVTVLPPDAPGLVALHEAAGLVDRLVVVDDARVPADVRARADGVVDDAASSPWPAPQPRLR